MRPSTIRQLWPLFLFFACLSGFFADPVRGEILFQDDFAGHAADGAPGAPWTSVHDGTGIGQIRVRADAGNFFQKGSGNAYLEYRKDETTTAMALRSLGTISTSATVSTFSIRHIESAAFDDFSWLILYAGPRSNDNRAQLINYGRAGDLGMDARRGEIIQVDLIVNNGNASVSYNGSHTVEPGTVDIWVNGRLARSGVSSDNNRRGPITGFEFNTSSSRTQTLLIDEIIVRDHPHVTEVPPPQRPFDLWRATHFTPEELEDESLSGPLADPVGDGFTNLEAYAFHFDPRAPAPFDARPLATMGEAGLSLSYTRVKAASDLQYTVETSGDLVEWTSGTEATEEIAVTDGGETERVVALDKRSLAGNPDRRFMRLRIDLADAPPGGDRFENLGSPMETEPIPIQSVTVNSGGQTIAWGTVTEPDRFAVIGVDVATGQAIELDLAQYGQSSQIRITRGESGHLYIYAGNAARFFKYDIDEHQLIDLGRPASPARYILGHAIGPDGRFYVGSYPATHLVSVDTATDEIYSHGRMTDDERLQYIVQPAVSDDNIVYVPVGLHHGELWAFDPATGVKRQILPASMMQDQGYTRVFTAADGNVYGEGFGRKFRCYPDKIVILATLPNPRADRSQTTVAGRDYREINVHGKLVAFDTSSGRRHEINTAARGRGVMIFSIGGIDDDGRLWGGGWSPARTWTYDVNTGEPRDWGKIVNPNTQVEATLIHPRGIFLASYLGAHVDLFSPATETRTHITSFYHSHDQERLPWLITGNDGMIYGPLQPVKGHLDGGIARIHPQTLAHAAWTGFLEHLTPTTLVAVPGTNLLFGGTTIQGSTGAIPQRDEAVVFLWDTVQAAVVWHEAILPGETGYRVMGGNDGLIYGLAGGKYFVFDPIARELLHVGDLPPNDGFTNRYRLAKQPCGPDGLIVGLMKGIVFAIDPNDFSIRIVARHPSILEDRHELLHSTRAIWASPDGFLYYGSGTDLWRVDLR